MEQALEVEHISENRFRLTIRLPDVVGLLSLVSGLLTSFGLNIRQGHIGTSMGRAVDVFEVTGSEAPDWKKFEDELVQSASQLKAGEQDAVRLKINQQIISYLRIHRDKYASEPAPIDLKIDRIGEPDATVLDVKALDTPAFLYELTSALALMSFNIRQMEVKTVGDQVEDRLWITTKNGEKITSPDRLKALSWAVLLIKQFTHFLPKVSDPKRALDTIILFGRDLFEREDFDEVLLALKSSHIVRDLCTVLGSSEFLWEEFIRFQHGAIVQILGDHALLAKRRTKSEMLAELKERIAQSNSFSEQVDRLNEFKDCEMFRIDLRHILGRTSFIEEFADELTDLTESVVEAAHELAWKKTLSEYKPPMVSETEGSVDCVFGLGKFGGREMGFASDIELLFVYRDDPDPASERSRDNLNFYTRLVQHFIKMIRARSEGVFEIDLRLRPYGKDGPLASSLEAFQRYYSPGGGVLDFERQALIKLRPVAGSLQLGEAVCRLRDAFVFSDRPFNFEAALELRIRQQKELVERGTLNAKYSKGGLLDIEYLVQTLQLVYGRREERLLRHSNTLKALEALRSEGILEEKIYSDLREAYVFLRALINALRIVRGNAKDLKIPPGPKELAALGRRMIYDRADFSGDDETVPCQVQALCEKHMKFADSLYQSTMRQLMGKPTPRPETARIDALAAQGGGSGISSDRAHWLRLGFLDPDQARARYERLIRDAKAKGALTPLLSDPDPIFRRLPDADLALKHLERFVNDSEPELSVWDAVCGSQRKFELLLALFGTSAYLSYVLIEHPEYLNWVLNREAWTSERTRAQLIPRERELTLEELRELKDRETLRIAMSEFFGNAPLQQVYRVYTELADHILERIAGIAGFEEGQLCVIGVGKLGGYELNFSSDVDLIFLGSSGQAFHGSSRAVEEYCRLLRKKRLDDFLYRVDLRLRPHGTNGPLLMSRNDYLNYYQKEADSWEYQMLLKARPVAGEKAAGETLIKALDPIIYRASWPPGVLERLKHIKRRYEEETDRKGETLTNIKMGRGGIRDIEFSVQCVQLRYGCANPVLKERNTLNALALLEKHKLLSEKDCRMLLEGYEFLRRVENRLQLYENAQTFVIPEAPARLRWLARSMGFGDPKGAGAECDQFMRKLRLIQDGSRGVLERTFYAASD